MYFQLSGNPCFWELRCNLIFFIKQKTLPVRERPFVLSFYHPNFLCQPRLYTKNPAVSYNGVLLSHLSGCLQFQELGIQPAASFQSFMVSFFGNFAVFNYQDSISMSNRAQPVSNYNHGGLG